jgi:hypothetical protein
MYCTTTKQLAEKVYYMSIIYSVYLYVRMIQMLCTTVDREIVRSKVYWWVASESVASLAHGLGAQTYLP